MSKKKGKRLKKKAAVKQDKPENQPKESSVDNLLEKALSGRNSFLITFGLLFVLAFICFKDFLFLDKLYLFKDIGSDTINVYYPMYVHAADYLRETGIPKWSFSQGMGQNIFPANLNKPFNLILYLVGSQNIAYAIGYIEFSKIILAGVIFYFYLKVIGLKSYTRIIGSLLFAFSGYMILGTGWYGHSATITYGAFLLLSFELLFKKNKWVYFPIAVFILTGSRLYFYVAFLAIYLLFRFFDEYGWQPKELGKLIFKVTGLGALGVAIAAPLFLSEVHNILESPRVGGEASKSEILSSKPLFAMEGLQHNVTAILRFFSNDLLGTGSQFKGWGNYLEAPVFYIGIITLLLFTQVFTQISKNRRKVYFAFIAVWIFMIIFPYFRYAFYLFSGDYYKNALSFFIPFSFLFLFLKGFDGIIAGKKINKVVLISTLIFFFILLFYPYFEDLNIVNPIEKDIRAKIALLFILYTTIAFALSKPAFKSLGKIALLFVLCFELASFSHRTVNDRDHVSAHEFESKTGYKDYTVDAVRYLKGVDNSFFRINKDYASGRAMHSSMNDAKVQKFFGTQSYSSFNQLYYINFLKDLDVIQRGVETQTRWAPGLAARPLLQVIASVKYNLIKGPSNAFLDNAYQHTHTAGDVKIFQNKYFLPLGFTYSHYVDNNEFMQLNAVKKDVALFQGCVNTLQDVDISSKLQKVNLNNLPDNYTFNHLAADVQSLRKEALKITSFSQNKIEGEIELKKAKILFLSIPWDKDWTGYVNGKETEIKIVTGGLMGILLEPGKYHIKLKYQPPFFLLGLIISFISILLFAGLVVYSRRKKPISPIEAPA